FYFATEPSLLFVSYLSEVLPNTQIIYYF
ncbi:hypothetical protein QAM_03208, partial [Enterococcus faecalis EnGen0070]